MQENMQEETLDAYELASALADGELEGAEFALALSALQASEEAQLRWHTYHLVGDVLRSGSHAAVGARDAAFVARLRQRLQVEQMRPQPVLPDVPASAQAGTNDSLWRWKLVAGFSSLAVVGILAWQLVMPRMQEGAAMQLAGSDSSAPTVDPAMQPARAGMPLMLRDPQLDQLIAAHQQFGGTSALQMPAGFLRNATFERPAR